MLIELSYWQKPVFQTELLPVPQHCAPLAVAPEYAPPGRPVCQEAEEHQNQMEVFVRGQHLALTLAIKCTLVLQL